MSTSAAPAAAPPLPVDLWTPGTERLRDLPPQLRDALTTTGLLTDHIAAVSGGPAGVRLVAQRSGLLSREQQALLAALAASCFVREVVLTGCGRPWVFAQSLVPDQTLAAHPWLAELGDRSLGAALAGIPDLQRGRFEFASLPVAHPLAARALAGSGSAPACVWARRSWFALRGRRLLVQEVFLPDVPPP